MAAGTPLHSANQTIASMLSRSCCLILALALIFRGYSQDKKDTTNLIYEIDRNLFAKRCTEPPKLNGSLDDAAWIDVPVATDFTVQRPNPGGKPHQRTEVKVVYDDEAVYIGFMCYDSAPDSILNQLVGRDADGNSDYCGISFSPYRDGINGWTFAVAPSGEQYDAQITNGGNEDAAWNAVWDCKSEITADGWIAEFRIPFSALRFPEQPEQLWAINLFREVRRIREFSLWNPVDPEKQGYVTQFGTLAGISGIDPPTRLFFYPYASGYVNLSENGDGTTTTTTSYNGGMDVKYGLSESFTLDATLVPDFGQTVSDALVLNLTPFEIQFQENRQFFTEGTELFSRGGLFYSRRIGFIPYDFDPKIQFNDGEYIKSYPSQTQLINATKISGRTKGGTGLGFLNAVSANEHVMVVDSLGNEREVLYYPLTNYNIVVVDQNLKNNSYVSLINTSVIRDGSAYDATVTGIDFVARNKKNSYSIRGNTAYNKKYNWDDPSTDDGYAFNISLNKTSGQFLFELGNTTESDTYDPNDFGFLFNNNSSEYWTWVGYQIYEPFGPFNRLWSGLFNMYSRLYNPNHFGEWYLDGNVGVTDKNFNTWEMNIQANPIESYDYFEPRIQGRYFLRPSNFIIAPWISTDYRDRLAWDLGMTYGTFSNDNHYIFNFRIAPRFRVNDHLMLTYVYSNQKNHDDLGWGAFDDLGNPVFGRRDVISHTNVLTADYSFNPIMKVSCRVRQYWGYSRYKEFYDLGEDGRLYPSEYAGFNEDGTTTSDQSFNSFTVDLVYKWIFSPGSEISIVWKNSIINSDHVIPDGLIDDVQHVFELPQSNSFSIKVLYFLDYRSLF